MEEHIRLIVTKRAQRILAEVRLAQRYLRELAHAPQRGYVLEVREQVAGEVKVLQILIARKRVAHCVDAIGAEPQHRQCRQALEALQPPDGVVIEP